jgi:hypothetical protein
MKEDSRLARQHLKNSLRRAVEVLGTGFLGHNRGGSSEVQGDALGGLLRAAIITAFRLAFLMHTPNCNLIVRRLRRAIEVGEEGRVDGVFSKGTFGLWEDLELFYGQMGRSSNEFVPGLRVSDYFLASAICLLGNTEVGRNRENNRQARLTLGDIRHLGDAYESILDLVPRVTDQGMVLVRRAKRSKRKLSGSYYTPAYIVQDIVEHGLGPLVRGDGGSSAGSAEPLTSRGILDLKVLDPAMGSGHFLLAATDYLARAYGRALRSEGTTRSSSTGSDDEMTRYRRLVAERCIYGVDIDPVAVEVAKLSMWLFTNASGRPTGLPDKHLRCGNSLLGAGFGEDPRYSEDLAGECGASRAGSEGRLKLEPFHWDLEFPETGFDRDGSRRSDPGFDAVIGNPPYLSLSGRQKAEGGEWMAGLSRAQGMGEGWMTAHGLFMVRAARLTRNWGFVSMVVPDQVGHLRGYAGVRAGMLKQGRLIQVRYWGEGVFEDATTPVLTFVFQKSRPMAEDEAIVIDREGTEVRFSPRPGDEWSKTQSRETYEKMLGLHPTLRGFSDPGVHTGNVAGKLILSQPGQGAPPVIEGKQIHPFRCDPPVRWLNTPYMPGEKEYFRISPRHVYEGTDVLIRQTASRPIAARHIFHCYFRNSVLALSVPQGLSIEYLLGILNSEAAAFLYRASSFESGQRAFPQVKVGQLRRLPVPDPGRHEDRRAVSRIEEIVRVLEAGEACVDERHPLMLELNKLVWALYGLSRPNSPSP